MASVRVAEVTDVPALEEQWRDLETRSNGSFFQSWTWTGCLFTKRFPDPVLVEATEAGRTVALGLFNRVRPRLGAAILYLGQTGSADLDCPYIEENGILAEAGREQDLTALCLKPLVARFDVVLAGVAMPLVAAAEDVAGLLVTERRQPSPFVDLAAIRRSGGDYLSARSPNTRQQIRRSDRFYERLGPIVLEAAASATTAHAMLDDLAVLHQKHWQRRGKGGSFSVQFFAEFHHALIEIAFPRNEIALFRIHGGDQTIGFLYNFIWRQRMLAYQCGFTYDGQASQAKPGLTCHHRAICYAITSGLDVYDFLAGDDRYKRSLADQADEQFWLQAGPIWSPRLLTQALLQRIRRLTGG